MVKAHGPALYPLGLGYKQKRKMNLEIGLMTAKGKILIVEDESVIRDVLRRLFRPEGYDLEMVGRGDEAIELLNKKPDFDVVITDLMLPGASGIEVLKASRELNSEASVILITAYATVDSAVDAMKAGAFDYMTKPFNNDQVLLTVKKALERSHLLLENRQLKAELNQKYGFENIAGNSPEMQEVFDLIRQAAPSNATILIRGESGTGKELFARATHYNSPRKNRQFVALNAGSFPSDLLESQLFGHVRGAFTGAVGDKKGLFESADRGSLFLDEVGNINLEIQAKLLRVIQEKEFMPVGSTRVSKVDVRLICATNADLEQMVADGKFREDLYYRLNVIEVRLPPLRERSGDLPVLVNFFINKYAKENQKRIERVEPDFMNALESYPWPGNVRELENLIERAVVLSRNSEITCDLLPATVLKRPSQPAGTMPDLDPNISFHEQIQTFEKSLLVKALERVGGVQKKAAALLGLKTTTLSEMLKRHKLR